MKVLVIDGSIQIIERLQQLLCATENVTSVYGAVAYKDGFALLKDIDPAIVLIDSRLANNECARLVEDINRFDKNIKVIVLLNGEPLHIKETYQALGAYSFIDKYHEFETIPAEVNKMIAAPKGRILYGIA